MKKLNVSEVANVVGGNVIGCVVSYKKETTGTGTSATSVCRKVTTCEGKYGEYTTRVPADLANCPD